MLSSKLHVLWTLDSRPIVTQPWNEYESEVGKRASGYLKALWRSREPNHMRRWFLETEAPP